MDMQQAVWGLFFAGMMYVIGNGVWVNHLVRQRIWLGWPLWLATGAIFLFLGAVIETNLDVRSDGIWQRLGGADAENHWIALSLYMLLSVPGAACVLFKQSANWTRISLAAPAIIVFIPAGMHLGSPQGGNIIAGLSAALAVCALVLGWQWMLDREETA